MLILVPSSSIALTTSVLFASSSIPTPDSVYLALLYLTLMIDGSGTAWFTYPPGGALLEACVSVPLKVAPPFPFPGGVKARSGLSGLRWYQDVLPPVGVL